MYSLSKVQNALHGTYFRYQHTCIIAKLGTNARLLKITQGLKINKWDHYWRIYVLPHYNLKILQFSFIKLYSMTFRSNRLAEIQCLSLSVTFFSDLLFISYKFVKGFFAITILLLVISSWNIYDVCERFLYNQKRNFSWIRQKMRNFPIDPHYKNRPFL